MAFTQQCPSERDNAVGCMLQLLRLKSQMCENYIFIVIFDETVRHV